MTVKVLQFDTYLDVIKKSVGSTLFQTIFAEVDGEKKDILNKGQYSCAAHVSSILLWFGLLAERHAGVAGLLRDMESSGWQKIDKVRPGAVILWEKWDRNGSANDHIGFYVGDEKAVCNDPDESTPIERHYTYGVKDGEPVRKIEAIYWHPKLENS